MLFKPWSEFERTSRHQLSESYDESKPFAAKGPVFQFSILKKSEEFSSHVNDELLLLPYNLKFIFDAIPLTKTSIATINITKTIESKVFQEDEFLEDEQLYSAGSKDEDFEVFELEVINIKNSLNIIVSPNIIGASSPIINNRISRFILTKFLTPKEILLLCPSTLNYSETLCKLSNVASKYSEIALLKPPHFITGITASIMSVATIKKISVTVLILDSEGVMNFERINDESIRQVGKLLSKEFFQFDTKTAKEFEREISKKSVVNDHVSSGMYI